MPILKHNKTGETREFPHRYQLEGLGLPDPESWKWLSADEEAAVLAEREQQEERKRRQLEGVEFNGMMLSATKNDQNGLLAVRTDFMLLQSQGVPLDQIPTVHFRFDNGTVFPITASNVIELEKVWKPFRMSFFPALDHDAQAIDIK